MKAITDSGFRETKDNGFWKDVEMPYAFDFKLHINIEEDVVVQSIFLTAFGGRVNDSHKEPIESYDDPNMLRSIFKELALSLTHGMWEKIDSKL